MVNRHGLPGCVHAEQAERDVFAHKEGFDTMDEMQANAECRVQNDE